MQFCWAETASFSLLEPEPHKNVLSIEFRIIWAIGKELRPKWHQFYSPEPQQNDADPQQYVVSFNRK
jgi:hypothetical protein